MASGGTCARFSAVSTVSGRAWDQALRLQKLPDRQIKVPAIRGFNGIDLFMRF